MDLFRKAVEARDLDAMVGLLSDDVVFHSPVTFRPFEGKDAVRLLFGILIETFDEFVYTDELTEGNVSVLLFKAMVDDKQVDGADIIRYNDSGEIADFTVMVRPLSSVMALGEAVGSRLQAGAK